MWDNDGIITNRFVLIDQTSVSLSKVLIIMITIIIIVKFKTCSVL